MSNTALPVEGTAGTDLIQHVRRTTITNRAPFENAFSKNLAF